jgi:nitrate/nitrite transporter NarK
MSAFLRRHRRRLLSLLVLFVPVLVVSLTVARTLSWWQFVLTALVLGTAGAIYSSLPSDEAQ